MPEQIPASLRQSLLAPLDSRGRVEEVERRLAEAIELGAFTDGEQLPSEAALAAQLAVSVVTLREALAGLRELGVVQTLRGRRGGSFVTQPAAAQRRRLAMRLTLIGADQLRDMGDMHAAVSAAAARLATERATDAERERMASFVDALANAATPTARRLADRRFHIELAAASHSLHLTRAEARLQTEAGSLLLLLSPDRAALALEEHGRILDAVLRHDADDAGRLMRAHVEAEFGALIDRRIELLARRSRARKGDAQDRLSRVAMALDTAMGDVFSRLLRAQDEVVRAIGAAAGAGRPLCMEDLDGLRASVERELTDRDQLMGMGVALSSKPSSDLTWAWWQLRDGRVVPLSVSLDPKHPEFYDFAGSEWFSAPMRSGQPTIAGPFVDFGGANEHIFTLTVPLALGPSASPIGVVGGDVSVRRVEEVMTSALVASAEDVAVISASGTIIASSTARWLPGMAWDVGEVAAQHHIERLGWTVMMRSS